jgi:isopentenyldiphosphate isomerase
MNKSIVPKAVSRNHTVEYFDVVDIFDRVVGLAPRHYIHANKLFHRAVHIFVFNRSGEIFLQKRSMDKDSAPGKWVSSCSGHVDSGEYYYDAAVRELGEEIGLYYPEDLNLAMIEQARPETGYEHVHLFVCNYDGELSLNISEVSDGVWIDPEKLDLWVEENPRDFAWSFVYLWKRYRRHF